MKRHGKWCEEGSISTSPIWESVQGGRPLGHALGATAIATCRVFGPMQDGQHRGQLSRTRPITDHSQHFQGQEPRVSRRSAADLHFSLRMLPERHVRGAEGATQHARLRRNRILHRPSNVSVNKAAPKTPQAPALLLSSTAPWLWPSGNDCPEVLGTPSISTMVEAVN